MEAGALSELRHVRQTRVDVVTQRSVMPGALPGTSGAVGEEACGLRLTIKNDSLNSVMATLVAAGIESIDARPPSLEELFLRLYEHRDEAPER